MAGLPNHPRLLLLASELPAIHARIANAPWAKSYYDALKKRSDDWLVKTVQLPAEGGQWPHWYVCPVHGVKLKTESPTKHICPIDGQVFTGYPYDQVVMGDRHNDFSNAVRDLGLMYQVTSDKRYASKAKEILLAYRDHYLTYPLHDRWNKPKYGGGHIMAQSLDESTWLIPMAQGMDCVWDILSPDEIEGLRTKLFYPATLDTIMRDHDEVISNRQIWRDSAIGVSGLLFGDKQLTGFAIDSDHGFRTQMEKGVSPNGQWFEGSWGYHFYSIMAGTHLTEAASRSGIDLYDDAFRKMFLAPIVFAMPNGKLPAFNDSGVASASGNANYEAAFLRYKDPTLAEPLQTSTRISLLAFTDGVDKLPPENSSEVHSQNFEQEGYGILAAGKGTEATWLCVKYGPHGGGHGHPDKNQFVVYANGRMIADDPGTELYTSPLHVGWDKTTLAHNTLTVDEQNQVPATGKCLGYKVGDGWGAIITDAGPAIPNISFRRAVSLGPELDCRRRHCSLHRWQTARTGSRLPSNGHLDQRACRRLVHPARKAGLSVSERCAKPGRPESSAATDREKRAVRIRGDFSARGVANHLYTWHGNRLPWNNRPSTCPYRPPHHASDDIYLGGRDQLRKNWPSADAGSCGPKRRNCGARCL
jgi:hypothetical protein